MKQGKKTIEVNIPLCDICEKEASKEDGYVFSPLNMSDMSLQAGIDSRMHFFCCSCYLSTVKPWLEKGAESNH